VSFLLILHYRGLRREEFLDSPTDVQPVLDAVCRSAARLCEAYDSAIWRPDGNRLLVVAHQGPINVESLPLIRGTIAGRTVLDGPSLALTGFRSIAHNLYCSVPDGGQSHIN
jgi:hypothetical protein